MMKGGFNKTQIVMKIKITLRLGIEGNIYNSMLGEEGSLDLQHLPNSVEWGQFQATTMSINLKFGKDVQSQVS